MSQFIGADLQAGATAIGNAQVGRYAAITTSATAPTLGAALTNEASGTGGSGTYARQSIGSVTAGSGGVDTLPALTFQVPAGTYYYGAIMTASTGGTVTGFAQLNGASGVSVNPAGAVNVPAGTITVA